MRNVKSAAKDFYDKLTEAQKVKLAKNVGRMNDQVFAARGYTAEEIAEFKAELVAMARRGGFVS